MTQIWPCSVGMSENGWTDDFLCQKWFEEVFIPQSKARNTSKQPILLIMDGHGSHITGEMRVLAEAHGIHILCFPPHTTHKLQPLDVGIFGKLQRDWCNYAADYIDENLVEIPRTEFIRHYMHAREDSFRSNHILSAFRKTGIRPYNSGLFTDADYAPSETTSIHAHVPQSFPIPSEDESDNDTEQDEVINNREDGDGTVASRVGCEERDGAGESVENRRSMDSRNAEAVGTAAGACDHSCQSPHGSDMRRARLHRS